uniref:Protein TRANSPORT INHIBITOR RESPONSE 1-like n=1 Tax=Elaeis guineensis var. tenera TaxID=51953 RepID=A0A8N4ESJ1_ELAGV|nr:protein TRANSPORT INHIBITOR RESPONSE 1-like [Elaeis guineensis]
MEEEERSVTAGEGEVAAGEEEEAKIFEAGIGRHVAIKKRKELDIEDKSPENRKLSFPDEVLERVLIFVKSHMDRSAVSLVCKDGYHAERWSRTHIFIGNCYSVSLEMVARRFPNIRSVTLKGKPRFYDFNLVPPNWGADIHSWLVVFASAYPFLEELRLKRMTVTDESLDFLARSFPGFKALSLVSCDGSSTDGLACTATYCTNLTELDIQESGIEDLGGSWLSCFPESFTSLEALNFANLHSEVNFDALERLAARCKSLKVLKLNKHVTLEQLRRLLMRAPQLAELGTGSFSQDHKLQSHAELESPLSHCKNLDTLSGLWLCAVQNWQNFCQIVLFQLWVLHTVEDKGLEAVASSCHLLEELLVFPADPFDQEVILEVATVIRNCPNFTHFRLCMMNMRQPDYLTNQPLNEAFGAVVKTCSELCSSDRGMQYVLEGCPKLRKLEIRVSFWECIIALRASEVRVHEVTLDIRLQLDSEWMSTPRKGDAKVECGGFAMKVYNKTTTQVNGRSELRTAYIILCDNNFFRLHTKP